MRRQLQAVVVSVLALSVCLTAAEIGRRVLDGYRVWPVGLERNTGNTDLTWSTGRATQALLTTIPRDGEADTEWFYDRPKPKAGTSPEWAEERRRAFDPGSNYVWNAARLKDPGLVGFLTHLRKDRAPGPAEIFTFRTPGGEEYPLYRFHPHVQTGLGMSNRFGWRGPDVGTEKAPNVIRIGVLGDSTTNNYPAMVEHWLNLWADRRKLGVQFEVLNAARPASGAPDAAAVAEFEFGAVALDYVIVYGFGNGIYEADALITLPAGLVKGHPAPASVTAGGFVGRMSNQVSVTLDGWTQRSAAAAFLRSRLMAPRGSAPVPEPVKPPAQLRFPQGIDEDSPDPDTISRHNGSSLMSLDYHLRALNRIDALAKKRGIRLFVSTFRIMAYDGMLLESGYPNGGVIYQALNEQYWWPYTYAQIRRLTSFYNRTLRAWADAHGDDTIPIDEQMPWQPDLYGDGMHERPNGEALHAWIVLQQLMPRIREDLADRRLPRSEDPPRAGAEEYWKIERTKVTDILDDPALDPQDEIAGPFLLSNIVPANNRAEVVPGPAPLIRTAMEPSSYAATIPIDGGVTARLVGKGLVALRVRVSDGAVTVGVLDRSGQAFLGFFNLTQAPDVQEVRLPVADLSNLGNLMISNNQTSTPARSVAELYSVAVYRVRE